MKSFDLMSVYGVDKKSARKILPLQVTEQGNTTPSFTQVNLPRLGASPDISIEHQIKTWEIIIGGV